MTTPGDTLSHNCSFSLPHPNLPTTSPPLPLKKRLSRAQLVKNPPAMQRLGFYPWIGKMPWRRERLPTPVFWPGEFHGLYSPLGHKESDTTFTFTFFKMTVKKKPPQKITSVGKNVEQLEPLCIAGGNIK